MIHHRNIFVILFAILIHGWALASSPSVEYVIAHYKEDLKWLKPYAHQAHVYHKGGLSAPPFQVAQWTPLDNVGREGHTYLFHIVENYDHLADITYFLQGQIKDHCKGGSAKNPKDLWDKVIKKGFAGLGKPHVAGEWTSGYPQWWEELLGEKKPDYVKFHAGACFAVKKELIRQHSKEYYEKIMNVLSHESNPFEGHCVERMWYFIFDPVGAKAS